VQRNTTDQQNPNLVTRQLMVLVGDIVLLQQSVERVSVQVLAMANQHGVEPAVRTLTDLAA
jgi:hypothetical protein